jgi:hypothetical protein
MFAVYLVFLVGNIVYSPFFVYVAVSATVARLEAWQTGRLEAWQRLEARQTGRLETRQTGRLEARQTGKKGGSAA